MTTVTSKLPTWIKKPLKKVIYHGNDRYCPVCEKTSKIFASGGKQRRDDIRCVHCGSVERDRFLWNYLNDQTDFFNTQPKNMLHIAPEKCFENKFRQVLGNNYLTADLYNPNTMIKMDITGIQFKDETFDVIYCSHVLEHVDDDRKAMREFYRVLKNDGWAILLVPICTDTTYEDPAITNPQERLKAFGQEDHVRLYGLDYVDRLRETGFNVKVTKVSDLYMTYDATRMGLGLGSGQIYYCTKN